MYGLATVLPRMLSFLLLPLYTDKLPTEGYGEVSVVFAWFAIFNVILAYGMETSFFRYFHGSKDKHKVTSTALISVLGSSLLFLLVALLFKNPLAALTNIHPEYIGYTIWIITLDALVVVPFAWLRANEQPLRYALVKILNVAINLGFNIFFLVLLPNWSKAAPEGVWAGLYRPDFEVSYIFISNLIASAATLLLMGRLYLKRPYVFWPSLWKQMLRYGMPVMVAGIAFTINEVFDRVLLKELLPPEIADSEVGKYAACYKLALFMTLFGTAFRMAIEPFFFSHSHSDKPQVAYAQITNYFVVLGSIILLGINAFSDILKSIFIQNPEYWEAMDVVPLIALGAFFLGIYHNLSVWYKVTDRTEFGAYISCIGAVITIVVNFVLIPQMGYMASAIATLLAYGCMMTLSYYFGKKYYPVPYNTRKISFYMVLSILFSAISFYLFNRSLIAGTLLFALFLGLVYRLESETLKKIFVKNAN